jgi:branched-chain amino acid transport system ATP-binding protein
VSGGLEVTDLVAGYGALEVLHNLTLNVRQGECAALVGMNGAGKSTFVKCLAGLVEARAGTVLLNGVDLTRAQPGDRIRHGFGIVLEGRRMFRKLTVLDNLRMAVTNDDRREWRRHVDRALEQFPELKPFENSLAGALSGGQQQMLVLAQALVKRPAILVVDEPTLGLAPAVVRRVADAVRAAIDGGTSVLVVEQSVDFATDVASRVFVMARGRVEEQVDTSVAGSAAMLRRLVLGGRPQD